METPADPLLARAAAADRGEALLLAPLATPPAFEVVSDPGAIWVETVKTWAPVVRACLPQKCADKFDAAREEKIGRALAKVAEKYGWTFGDTLGHPVAALFAECFPVAEPVVMPFVMAQLARKAPPPAAAPVPDKPAGDPPGDAPPAVVTQ